MATFELYFLSSFVRVVTKVSFLFLLFFDCSVTSLQCSKVVTVTLQNVLSDFAELLLL